MNGNKKEIAVNQLLQVVVDNHLNVKDAKECLELASRQTEKSTVQLNKYQQFIEV